ncbi:sensor histidine kinase [Microbacterium istanbulense]|uniref:histidine kinase n=1 Tax=Microbacterium istanbulense TaxID=3122049 RepID=A0ABU8LI10_9MICO
MLRSYPEIVKGLLRSAWNAPSAVPAPPRRVWRDWALLAVLVVAAVTEGMLRIDRSSSAIDVIALLAVLPTVLWRRTQPLLMLAIVFAVTVPVDLLFPGPGLYTGLFVLVLIYALFRWAAGRDLMLATVLVLATVGVFVVRGIGLDDLVGGIALLLAVALTGIAVRYRAGAEQRLVDGIRMQEREHLARDLHDTVAHHVSAITIRAQAGLAVAEHDPRAGQAALRVIEEEAATTLRELRAMVRVLRQGETAELAPSPRLDDIHQLAGATPAGPVVTVQVVATGGDVPPPVAAAVFRLAQESVTNALRHARQATRIDVLVEADAGGVRLRVTDDGGPSAPPTPGFGIIGMMERAALLGGTCEAGPVRGGWAVVAVLPRAGWAA